MTGMKRGRRHAERQHGFTLVEVLAALAITSVIIVATGALVHNVALYFERGTRGVSEGERLILAVERLAADIGSARFRSAPRRRSARPSHSPASRPMAKNRRRSFSWALAAGARLNRERKLSV